MKAIREQGQNNPPIFRRFETGPEIIHLAVVMYVCCPPLLRNV